MAGESGFLHLNEANAWRRFEPGDLVNMEIVSADGSLRLERLGPTSFAERGLFLGGPFEVFAGPTPWFRLRTTADSLPDGTHVRLFTLTAGSDLGEPPYDPGSPDQPFDPALGWRAAPLDALDLLIPNPPAERLWIGGIVRGDGLATPTLRQMRVDYGRDTYLNLLPAIYSEDAERRDFAERFLSLFQSLADGVDSEITDLTRLFDPWASPAGGEPSWLWWLAGWLAAELDERWDEPRTRQFIADAFQLYGLRGTMEGLRLYLKWYAGVEAHIDEPLRHAALWSLGRSSRLGFTTRLATGQIGGAVVDASAILDASHLATSDDCGASVFEDAAHRFCVRVYCAELSRPGALEDVRAVIEREKPAHTAYHLCVIEPRFTVGAQALVGIDAIVGQGPAPARLGDWLGMGALAERSEDCSPGGGLDGVT